MKKKPAKKKRNGDLFLFAAQICAEPEYDKGACYAFEQCGAMEAYCEEKSRNQHVAFFADMFRPHGADCYLMAHGKYKAYAGWWGRKDPARVIGLLLAKAMWERP